MGLHTDAVLRIMDAAVSHQVAEALDYLHKRVPKALRWPLVGIICGSGLNSLSDAVLPEPSYEIPYAHIPHFAKSTGQLQLSMHYEETYADRT